MLPEVSSADKNMLLKIMLFYSLLTYLVFPVAGLYLKKNKEGLTHGMIAGSIVSIFLWVKFGSKMISLQ